MDPTERAISHANVDAHDEPSEAHWGSCTTLAHPKPNLLPPNGTIDENVITVGWDGPDDPDNPRKCASTLPLFRVWLTVFFYMIVAGAPGGSGELPLLCLPSHSSAPSPRQSSLQLRSNW